MSKYYSLEQYLRNNPNTKITLTFREIEEILGFSLPNSAHTYPDAWWGNDITHTQACSWLNAGWEVKSVNMTALSVTFVRTGSRRTQSVSKK